jgi:hypothetical protein
MTYFDRDPYDIDGRDEARADAMSEAREAAQADAEYEARHGRPPVNTTYWTPEREVALAADLMAGVATPEDADTPDGVPF